MFRSGSLGGIMHYLIGENNSVSIYANENDVKPFWYQPTYPNGDTFDSAEEASQWAELAIQAQTDESAPYPPNGKGIAGEAKPTSLEKTQSKLEAMGISIDDLKTLLGI